jgi:hypothetical protein
VKVFKSLTPIGVALAIDVVPLTSSATASAAAHFASPNKSYSLVGFGVAGWWPGWLGLAEEVGFEPTEGFPSHDFQSCRFGRSRTPPQYRHAPFEMNTGSQGYPSRFEYRSGSLFNAEVHRSGRVPCDDRL